MMYPQKKIGKPQKTIAKPVNIANLINEKIAERQRIKQPVKNPFLKSINPLSLESGIVQISLLSKAKDGQALRQYIQILEQKYQNIKAQNSRLTTSFSNAKTKDESDNLTKQSYFYSLQQFYSKSRKLMLQICLQLVDCKGVFLSYSQSSKFSNRIDGISKLLIKIQSFLKSSNIDTKYKPKAQQQQRTSLRQLTQTVNIQQKSIKHLRQLSKYPQQQSFQQQRRLLRFQMNRLFTQNQKLKEKCGLTYSQFLIRLKSNDFENQRIVLGQTIRQYFDVLNNQIKSKDIEYRHKVEKQFIQTRLQDEQQALKKLQSDIEHTKWENNRMKKQIQSLNNQTHSLIEQNNRFKLQFKKMNESLIISNEQIQKRNIQIQQLNDYITKLEKQKKQLILNSTPINNQQKVPANYQQDHHQKSIRQSQLEEELNDLKQKLLVTEVLLQESNSRLRSTKQDQQNQNQRQSPIKRPSNKHITSFKSFEHTLEQKILFLQQYLREQEQDYYLIFKEYRRKNEQTEVEFKSVIEKMNGQKDLILGWCRKKSDIPEQTIQEHLHQLDELQKSKKTKTTKIMKFLQSIKECAQKFDKHQQREVQEQLQQYVVTLKRRGDIIQQVSNQDGSSVATVTDFRSQAFTDFEDRLSNTQDDI